MDYINVELEIKSDNIGVALTSIGAEFQEVYRDCGDCVHVDSVNIRMKEDDDKKGVASVKMWAPSHQQRGLMRALCTIMFDTKDTVTIVNIFVEKGELSN